MWFRGNCKCLNLADYPAGCSSELQILQVVFLLSSCNTLGQTGGAGLGRQRMDGRMDGGREGGRGRKRREEGRRGSGMTHIAKLRVFIVKKCPNWWASGSATALRWYPPPCPSPPSPLSLLLLSPATTSLILSSFTSQRKLISQRFPAPFQHLSPPPHPFLLTPNTNFITHFSFSLFHRFFLTWKLECNHLYSVLWEVCVMCI